MDELSPPRTDTERYAVLGWSALERGDLAEARAALQDLYTADPTHPALPLLAAGIRRIRPKPVPWRPAVLLLIVVAAGIAAVRLWNRDDRATRAPQPATAKTAAASLPQSSAAPQPTAPAEVRPEVGTTGPTVETDLPTAKENPSSMQLDEDLIVRQVIQRFEETYRNRWGGLAFEHCDIARDNDQATAACRPRQSAGSRDAESQRVWRFSLRKGDGVWRIVSAQPPPDSEQ